MFTAEGVLGVPHPAEATARYWLMRASNELSPEQRQFEAQLQQRLDADLTVSDGLTTLHRELEASPRTDITALAAARLLVCRTLYIDCFKELLSPDVDEWGVQYRTEDEPQRRLAWLLEVHDPQVVSSFPPNTATFAYPYFAYAMGHDSPFTVIHGDFDTARTHIMEAHEVPEDHVVPLTPTPAVR